MEGEGEEVIAAWDSGLVWVMAFGVGLCRYACVLMDYIGV